MASSFTNYQLKNGSPWLVRWLCVLSLSCLVAATINSESLWTDEAFSAFIASHKSFAACWSTLLHGDSSDLQMVLYYQFLHGWLKIFGQSEIALRTANVPFIILYSAALVWASERLFGSRWAWIIAASAPLAIKYASIARPYFDVIALTLTCSVSLMAYLQQPSARERVVLPWIILISFMMSVMSHLLAILAGPPLLIIGVISLWRNRGGLKWRDWKWPLLVLSPVGLALFMYLAWTLQTPTAAQYGKPTLLSVASLLFRFVGLSGYSPNRRDNESLRPYIVPMAIATLAFLGGLALAVYRSKKSAAVMSLFAALAAGVLELVLLELVLHKQIEVRYTVSLLPFLLLLIMAGLSALQNRTYMVCAAAAIGLTWTGSDFMFLTAPEFRHEDFKASVRKVIALAHESSSAVAIVADPAASAYYGLEMRSLVPCMPVPASCQDAFAEVPWPRKVAADAAIFWPTPQIEAWLQEQSREHRAAIVLMNTSREPIFEQSKWWPVLRERAKIQAGVRTYFEHGFMIYLVP